MMIESGPGCEHSNCRWSVAVRSANGSGQPSVTLNFWTPWRDQNRSGTDRRQPPCFWACWRPEPFAERTATDLRQTVRGAIGNCCRGSERTASATKSAIQVLAFLQSRLLWIVPDVVAKVGVLLPTSNQMVEWFA